MQKDVIEEPQSAINKAKSKPVEMLNIVKEKQQASAGEATSSPPPVLPPQPEDLALQCRAHSTPNMNVVAFESRTERLLNQHKRLEVCALVFLDLSDTASIVVLYQMMHFMRDAPSGVIHGPCCLCKHLRLESPMADDKPQLALTYFSILSLSL